MIRFAFPDGGSLLLTSRWKANDPHPERNFCYIAAQAIEP